MENSQSRQRQKLHLLLDSAMFLAFLVATAPRFSGIAVHEWLGLAFAVAVITHLLLNWAWIVGITQRLFGRIQAQARLNYMLNLLLFIDVTVLTFTGLVISQVALPLLGLHGVRGGAWRAIHNLTSDAAVLLIGAHLALNWSWVVKVTKRLLGLRPIVPVAARLRADPGQKEARG